MQPPAGGATFLDPMMRNSREFPKWLNAPETKEKLKGKKVMMYCTGGIRCERATAGGFLRTSTPTTLNRRTASARLYGHQSWR